MAGLKLTGLMLTGIDSGCGITMNVLQMNQSESILSSKFSTFFRNINWLSQMIIKYWIGNMNLIVLRVKDRFLL